MSGYMVRSMDLQTLIEFAREEYPKTQWTTFTESSHEHHAVWGWDEDGEYRVGLAIKKYKETDPGAFYKNVLVDEEGGNGWFVKIICEAEGPVIRPSHKFLETRPLLKR